MRSVLLLLAVVALGAADLFADLAAETERLGLPRIEGSWWSGQLRLPGDPSQGLGRRGPHVRRTDGTWLVDLVVAVPEARLDPDDIVLLTAMPGPGLGEAAGSWGLAHQTAKLLRLAALGVPGAAERCAWTARHDAPPPTPAPDNLDNRLRWALFRALRETPALRDGAVGILPPAWQAVRDVPADPDGKDDEAANALRSSRADAARRRPELDALVAAWLAQSTDDDEVLAGALPALPGGLRPAQNSVLGWWILQPQPPRWQRMLALLADDPAHPAALRLRSALGWPWYVDLPEPWAGDGCWPALCWLALDDQRPLPEALRPALGQQDPRSPERLPIWSGTPAADLRCADLVADQLLNCNTVMAALSRDDPALAAWSPDAARTVRDRAIAVLRDWLAPQAIAAIQTIPTALPPGLEAPAGTGLTEAEATTCRQVLAEARSLGFPDLTGAEVFNGALRDRDGNMRNGTHLRCADGSWLRLCVEPLAAAAVADAPTERLAVSSGLGMDGGTIRRIQRLPASIRARITASWNQAGDGMWSALTRWLNGSDRDGRGLAAAVLFQASEMPGSEAPLRPAGGASAGSLWQPSLSVPTVPDGLRRMLSGWFRSRLAAATTADDAARWHSAAVAILAEADRPAWRAILDRLRDRLALPTTTAPTADLATRLASWNDELRNPPARREDTAALLALAGDLRSSRWLDDGWPRTVGDNALRALGQLYRVDVRWLASPGEADRHRWLRGPWDDRARTQVGTDLAGWAATRNLSDLVAAVLGAMPTGAWDNVWSRLPEPLPAGVGAVVAGRVAELPGLLRDRGARALLSACLRTANDPAVEAAVAALPESYWHTRLTALRASLSGRPEAFDGLLDAALDDAVPPPGDERNPLSMLHPLNNLGLWAHVPTPVHLARLRTVLAGPLDRDATILMIAKLGFARMEVLGSWVETDRFTPGKPAPYAIPAALVLAALDDRRVVPVERHEDLRRWCPYDRSGAPLMPGLRVCDWAAAQLMHGHGRLGLSQLPSGADNRDVFRGADLGERDRSIAALRTALAPMVAEYLAEAGLVPRPADPGPGF